MKMIKCKECDKKYPFKTNGITTSNAIKSKEYCSRECEIFNFKGFRDCLQIGSGYLKMPNSSKEHWINLDIAKEVEPDLVLDIEKGLPFKDNAFDIVYSSMVLEHIKACRFKFVLEEIHRVTKPNGILHFNLPFDNISNRMDIDHHRCFSWKSFHHNEYNCGRNYYTKFIIKKLNKLPNFLWRYLCYLFPLLQNSIYFELEVIK